MKLAVFDFDGTLFPQDTLPFLLKQWKQLRYSRAKLYRTYLSVSGIYLKYRFGKGSREALRLAGMRRFTHIFSGMDKKEYREFLHRSAGKIIRQLNGDVVGEIKKTKAAGYHTVLLSGCYETFLKYVGGAIGIDTVIGTKIHYKDGRIDMKTPLKIVSGAEKAESLLQHFKDMDIDWQASCAYGDSDSDLPILERVGQPVAVNPEAALQKTAEQNGWRVMQTAAAGKRKKAPKSKPQGQR